MNLADALRDVNLLAVDTAIFIYYLEKHPAYFDRVKSIFEYADQSRLSVIAASLTLTEVLTKPIQVDNRRLQHQYRDFLLSTRNLNVVATDVIIAIKAAELRAAHNLKTPDALHVATAIMREADAFLTNDAGIRRVDEITVLVLDDLEIDPPDTDAS